MKLFAFLSILFFTCGCNSNETTYKRKKVGDKFIETNFINDSIYQGLTKYFSSSNVLESEIEFKNGVKNGYSKNYYPTGVVHDSMTYINGLAHGFHFVYDSTGTLEYKDYFHQGRKVGGIYFYQRGKIAEYNFSNFEGQPLFIMKYDSLERLKEFGGSIINMQPSTKVVDDQRQNVLFLYLLDPPKIKIVYSIGEYDSTLKKREILNDITTTQEMFVEFTPPPIRKNHSYYIQSRFADSSSKYSKVDITPFEF